MESNPCEKTRGEGVPSSGEAAPTASLVETAEAGLCRHIDARGHRCRMLVTNPPKTLCVHHAQRQNQGPSEAAQELLAAGTGFGDAASVNRFLGALVRQVTMKRIPRRDAITLAYLCQLLLNSLSAIGREEALRLEESRVKALNVSKYPTQILWDIPGPDYEPSAEEVLARQISEERRRG